MNSVPEISSASAAVGYNAQYSRYYQRIGRRYHALMNLPGPALSDRPSMEAALAQLQAEQPLGAALRILRQLVLAHLIERDVDQQAPLEEVTRTMTELAELALDRACAQAREQLALLHGQPRDAQGRDVQFWVVGMGKLGARELNVSSDIDLIYVYEAEGQTSGNSSGQRVISNQQFFAQMVRELQTLVGDTTEHGFVFRMDLALRPHGKSGPPAIALSALHRYFLSHGREWERFAWLKSRIVAPDHVRKTPNAHKLREAVLPFVFRRYLDYSVFDALRSLHRQVREHANACCAGRPERANNVKLSSGGIREIEFTVQLLQVVRGGSFPELRCRATLDALNRLTRAGLMPAQTAADLASAYVFLRRTEHRIQYLDDRQTHILPTDDDDLHWIATTMGFDSDAGFLRALDQHRELVVQEFDSLLGGSKPEPCSKGGCGAATSRRPQNFTQLLRQLPPAMAQHIHHWDELPRFAALRQDALNRVLVLLQSTGRWLANGETTESAATRFCDWLESLLGRESYFSLLTERPAIHWRVLSLLGASKWPWRYMLRHPVVVDELANGAMLKERFDARQFEHQLQLRRAALNSTREGDDEALMDVLRRGHHAEIFGTLARDVERLISIESVADDLSSLADSILSVTTQWCWRSLRKRHREEPAFAIIGYGKLGGKELGYGSDLDIVFVYDDDHEDAPVVYANLVRKLITWLSVKTGEGQLYEIDTALRPNGNSGLLVTSFQAYARYQLQRGSNTAWTWEHQAITRARFVLGSDHLRQQFEQVRRAVLESPRDHEALRREIGAMRDRLGRAHPAHNNQFDLKYSPGGMIDIEFATQFLVLAWASRHPTLSRNSGNIALLKTAEDEGLLPSGIGYQAADAYREMRRQQHLARLNELPAQLPMAEAEPLRQAGLALHDCLFPAPQA